MKTKLMKKVALLTAVMLAFAGITACGSEKADTTETAKQEVEAAAEGKVSTGEDAVETSDEKLVTIADVYEANDMTVVLSNHSIINVDYQALQSDGSTYGSGQFQIRSKEDGDIAYAYKFDAVAIGTTEGQGSLKSGCVISRNAEDIYETVMMPEDFIFYAQREAYLINQNTYNFSKEENSMQDDALIVSADCDDVGKIYMYVNPETLELYAINIEYSDLTVSYAISYDNDVKLNVNLADELMAGNTAHIKIVYMNDSYSEDYEYEVPADSYLSVGGLKLFDLFSSENCSDDTYLMTYEVKANDDVTLFAKYIPE